MRELQPWILLQQSATNVAQSPFAVSKVAAATAFVGAAAAATEIGSHSSSRVVSSSRSNALGCSHSSSSSKSNKSNDHFTGIMFLANAFQKAQKFYDNPTNC